MRSLSSASLVTTLFFALVLCFASAAEAPNCGDSDESGESGECAIPASLAEEEVEEESDEAAAEPSLLHRVELMNFRTLEQVKLDYDKNIRMLRNQTWLEVENKDIAERWEKPFNYTCHLRPQEDPMGRPDEMWQAMFGAVQKAKEAANGEAKAEIVEERLKSLPEEFTFQVPQSRGAGKASRVWPGSAVLARALEGGLVDLPHGARVLELGAGTGLLSLVLSKCVSRLQLDVTATELPGTALDNLRAVVSDVGGDSAITIDGLDWQNTTKLRSLGSFDAVFGGSVIYEREHTQLMLDLLKEIPLSPQGVVILAMGVPALPAVGERGFLKQVMQSERFRPMYVSKKELSRVMYPLHSEESWLLVLQQK